jgi:hypothetical protein
MKLGGEVSLGFFLVGAPVSISHPRVWTCWTVRRRTRQAPPAPPRDAMTTHIATQIDPSVLCAGWNAGGASSGVPGGHSGEARAVRGCGAIRGSAVPVDVLGDQVLAVATAAVSHWHLYRRCARARCPVPLCSIFTTGLFMVKSMKPEPLKRRTQRDCCWADGGGAARLVEDAQARPL